jgi:sucrose-6-phosphate hydrolase SacC (GH32 family)
MHENSPVGMPRNVGNEQSRTMHVNGSSTQRESALATMGLLTGEQVIEARAFLDQTFVEIYVNKGRVTVTGFSVDSGPGDLGFTVFPGGGYVQQSVVAYAIDQAWVE